MTTPRNKLLIAAASGFIAITACDKARIATENGGQAVELTQHGNITCVLIDSRVFCGPAKMRASMRLVSSTEI
jgi:hypothetical protein